MASQNHFPNFLRHNFTNLELCIFKESNYIGKVRLYLIRREYFSCNFAVRTPFKIVVSISWNPGPAIDSTEGALGRP